MRHILITGATDGIGKVAARELGAASTTLWLVGRNPAKTEAVVKELSALRPGAVYRGLVADLSLGAEVKRLALELKGKIRHLDVLLNNAGAYFATFTRTAEGFESTFALNHLSYFILTHHLLGLLQAAPQGRVVSVSSDAHRGRELDFSDLQGEKNYRGFEQYGRSKLCNILFTKQLAQRLKGTPVTANCLHPGFVATKFGHNNGGFARFAIMLGQKLIAVNEDKGAATSVYLASDPAVTAVSGGYFEKCRLAQPTAAARDPESAAKLWTESESLAKAYL